MIDYIALGLAIIALVVSLLKKPKIKKVDSTGLNWEYTKEGIVFYDAEGKEIIIKAKKL